MNEQEKMRQEAFADGICFGDLEAFIDKETTRVRIMIEFLRDAEDIKGSAKLAESEFEDSLSQVRGVYETAIKFFRKYYPDGEKNIRVLMLRGKRDRFNQLHAELSYNLAWELYSERKPEECK